MIIAEHHRPGHWKYDPSENRFEPKCAWPETCLVQWGGGGIVISRDPKGKSYVTAFFEAFPEGTFIRGEGKTIEEAEQKAFAQHIREQGCDHVYGRRGYNNGVGFCVKCKHFQSHAFPEIYRIGEWKKPLTRSEQSLLEIVEGTPKLRDPERTKYYRKLALRKALFGVEKDAPPRGGLEGLFDALMPTADEDDGK